MNQERKFGRREKEGRGFAGWVVLALAVAAIIVALYSVLDIYSPRIREIIHARQIGDLADDGDDGGGDGSGYIPPDVPAATARQDGGTRYMVSPEALQTGGGETGQGGSAGSGASGSGSPAHSVNWGNLLADDGSNENASGSGTSGFLSALDSLLSTVTGLTGGYEQGGSTQSTASPTGGGAPTTASGNNAENPNYRNSDTVGWIQIPDTHIDYPVLQTSDNEFYLSHNYYGQESVFGAIYLDANYRFGSSQNATLYGHSSLYGRQVMFEGLNLYEDQGYCLAHPSFYFTSKYDGSEPVRYDIVAVLKTDNLYNYNQSSFLDQADFMAYYRKIMADSLYTTGVEIREGDSICTLSTCVFDIDNGRLAVIGRRAS